MNNSIYEKIADLIGQTLLSKKVIIISIYVKLLKNEAFKRSVDTQNRSYTCL